MIDALRLSKALRVEIISLDPPDDLIARYTAGGGSMKPGTVMMSGTLNAIGGIRPASRFEMRLEDPATGRAISHAYDVSELPVVV